MPKLKFKYLSLVCFWLTSLLYSLWSFSLTDPNLVFSSWAPYWSFQNWLWQNLFSNAELLAKTFLIIVTLMWLAFGWIWYQSRNWQFNWQKWSIVWLIAISPLLFSNNALSHDVFNYIFNAKMVLIYHTNPHINVALDFANDPLTRFMHNTHTPAPYGYGWTIFSLLPSLLGMQKFVLTYWLFRCLSALAVIWLIWILIKLHHLLFGKSISSRDLILVIFNPLFVIEIISNSHNDLWLIMPALVSVYLISIWSDPRPNLKIFFYSLGALIFSISTKFASVLLVPIWITTLSWPFPTSDRLRQQINNELAKLSVQLGMKLTWSTFWPLISSFMMFLPLVLTRSQQFNPWYFIWILVWLPLIKLDWWRQTILAFSVSSLLRYLPWLMTGGYSPVVLTNQKQITWLIPLVWLLIYRGYQQYQYNKLNH